MNIDRGRKWVAMVLPIKVISLVQTTQLFHFVYPSCNSLPTIDHISTTTARYLRAY